MSQTFVAEAPAHRTMSSSDAMPTTRSRIAAAWRYRRDLDRQRSDLGKSQDATLGRDTGCKV